MYMYCVLNNISTMHTYTQLGRHQSRLNKSSHFMRQRDGLDSIWKVHHIHRVRARSQRSSPLEERKIDFGTSICVRIAWCVHSVTSHPQVAAATAVAHHSHDDREWLSSKGVIRLHSRARRWRERRKSRLKAAKLQRARIWQEEKARSKQFSLTTYTCVCYELGRLHESTYTDKEKWEKWDDYVYSYLCPCMYVRVCMSE